jgi:hypothetical protein
MAAVGFAGTPSGFRAGELFTPAVLSSARAVGVLFLRTLSNAPN